MRFRPWSLDITPDDAGNPPFATDLVVDPYFTGQQNPPPPLEWQSDDWDPALRFWALPAFDPQLTEWLKVVDPSLPSIQAAREFAPQIDRWGQNTAFVDNWLTNDDLAWRSTAQGGAGFARIRSEIEQLRQLMEDDRERYLAEIEGQADALAEYMLAFIAAPRERYPWTWELVNCGLAITNIAYMRWKSLYRRVRPSFLCPGLLPPFGPPGHPAFPSGHSTAGHLLALFLLEIPQLQLRFGVFRPDPLKPNQMLTVGDAPKAADLQGAAPIASPLLWLAARMAKNRERLGVHYPSDSSAGRHLAAALWTELLHPTNANTHIDCPTLRKVLARAQSEWAA